MSLHINGLQDMKQDRQIQITLEIWHIETLCGYRIMLIRTELMCVNTKCDDRMPYNLYV